MDIRITTRHCDIPKSTRDRTHELMEKLDRFDPRVQAVEVTFSEEKHRRRVDGVVSVAGDQPVVAEGEAGEFRDALDTLNSRLVKILRRRRSQVTDRRGPSLSEVAQPDE